MNMELSGSKYVGCGLATGKQRRNKASAILQVQKLAGKISSCSGKVSLLFQYAHEFIRWSPPKLKVTICFTLNLPT
jgi:hypothetical protein